MVSVTSLTSIAIHALLLGSLIVGFGSALRPDVPPDSLGVENGQESAGDEPALEWVNLDEEPTAQQANEGPPPLPAPMLARTLPVRVSLPRVEIPSESDEPARTVDQAREQPGDSHLYGLYVGQIDARIERAWLRPRTGIGAPSFSCRVRIEQSTNGGVEEVALEKCNGTARWQSSLVQAIRSASPLPAPPDPSVFARTVRLSFRAEPYRQGSPRDDYEPETAAVIAANDRDQASEALDQFGAALKATKSGVIDLRIVGHTDPIPPPQLITSPGEPAAETQN